jgi:DNA-binding transcriptional regulator PaaX
MGITVIYQRLSPEKFAQIQNYPELAEEFFHPNQTIAIDLHNRVKQAQLENNRELIQQLSSQILEVLHRDKASIYEEYLDINKTRLSLGKEWQAIHYLLTGEIEFDESHAETILKNVVMGGISSGFEATYDDVRYLSPEDVKNLAQALQQVSREDLRTRFDERGDRDIYSQEDEWDEETWQLLVAAIDMVTRFFQEASDRDEAILIS